MIRRAGMRAYVAETAMPLYLLVQNNVQLLGGGPAREHADESSNGPERKSQGFGFFVHVQDETESPQ